LGLLAAIAFSSACLAAEDPATPLRAQSQEQNATGVPERLLIRAELRKPLDSKKSKVGDVVQLVTTAPIRAVDLATGQILQVVVPVRAWLKGRVVTCEAASSGKPARLGIVVDRATWENHGSMSLNASIQEVGFVKVREPVYTSQNTQLPSQQLDTDRMREMGTLPRTDMSAGPPEPPHLGPPEPPQRRVAETDPELGTNIVHLESSPAAKLKLQATKTIVGGTELVSENSDIKLKLGQQLILMHVKAN